MIRRRRTASFSMGRFFIFFLFIGLTAQAASRVTAMQTVDRAAKFLDSISTRGGFVGIYSLDLKKRFGEGLYEKAGKDEIWVQPPGTPSVGAVFLRLYQATGNDDYLRRARSAGWALAWGQRQEGGWDHRVNVSALTDQAERPIRVSGRCTFDDRITQGALEFLMDLDQVIDESWLDESLKLGLEFVMRAQFENGGWSQWFPLRGGYHDYFTFNDSAINDCITLMLYAHELYRDERFLRSAIRGGEFIRLSQLPAPQAGWGQQYSHDLKPAWARRFEPPGVCSAATVHNLETLIELFVETGDVRFLEPFEGAIEWLQRSVLPADQISRLKFPVAQDRQRRLWARLYEVGSNRPIYGDREIGNQVFYNLDEISARERNSYGWQGTFGVDRIVGTHQEIKRVGALAWRAQQGAGERQASAAKVDARRVDRIVASQDRLGRWTTDDQISIGDFVANLNVLCSYLESNPN